MKCTIPGDCLLKSLSPERMMIKSLRGHNHHMINITLQQYLESCSGGQSSWMSKFILDNKIFDYLPFLGRPAPIKINSSFDDISV